MGAREQIAMGLVRTREKLGITQAELAKKGNMSPSNLSRIESGKAGINLSQLFGLCKSLNTTPSALVKAANESAG